MSFRVTVETLPTNAASDLDRVQTFFHEPSGESHWSVLAETHANPHRAFYTVMHDGWVVWEVTARPTLDECFQTLKPWKKMPPEVVSHVPRLTR